jgi:hypothetical protein
MKAGLAGQELLHRPLFDPLLLRDELVKRLGQIRRFIKRASNLRLFDKVWNRQSYWRDEVPI